jgi:hypothetical protein
MSGSISNGSILNLITVFLVLSPALRRSKRMNIQMIINVTAIAVTMPICFVTEGFHGVAICLSGAGAAAILAIPLRRLGWMERADIFTTCTIGALVGPVSIAISCVIATGFVVAQHALKARMTNMTERLFSISPFFPLTPYNATIRPSLVEMESHRMLDDDSREGIAFGNPCTTRGEGTTISITTAGNELLPWPDKIALATIAVLMLGIHL